MKKYMIVGLLLLQGAIMQASEMEFYQAIAPSLQNAKSVLRNPMISAELDPVLNGLVGAVQNGAISKQAALNIINDIKNAVKAYKSKQYSNSWLSWFVSTPKIVKDTVQPALDKVNNAIAVLTGNEWTPLAIAGVTVGAVAGAVAAVGGGYAVYKWNKNRKKKQVKPGVADEVGQSNPFSDEQTAAQTPSSTSSSISDVGDYQEREAAKLADEEASARAFSRSLDSNVGAQPAASSSRRAAEQSSSTPPPPPTPPLASALSGGLHQSGFRSGGSDLSGANIIRGPALEDALFNRRNLLDDVQFDERDHDKSGALYANVSSRWQVGDTAWMSYVNAVATFRSIFMQTRAPEQTPENLVGFIFDCTEFEELLARKDVVYKLFPQYVTNGSLEAGIKQRIKQGAVVRNAYSASSIDRATDRHSAAASDREVFNWGGHEAVSDGEGGMILTAPRTFKITL